MTAVMTLVVSLRMILARSSLAGDNVGDLVGVLLGALDFVGLSVIGTGVGVGLKVGSGDVVGDGAKIMLMNWIVLDWILYCKF